MASSHKTMWDAKCLHQECQLCHSIICRFELVTVAVAMIGALQCTSISVSNSLLPWLSGHALKVRFLPQMSHLCPVLSRPSTWTALPLAFHLLLSLISHPPLPLVSNPPPLLISYHQPPTSPHHLHCPQTATKFSQPHLPH